MQLLSSEQLEYAFQVHGISLEVEARKFYADVWTLIQSAERIRDPLELSRCETDLRHLCREYFSLMSRWQQEEDDKHEGCDVCPISRTFAEEARSFLPAFEKQFFSLRALLSGTEPRPHSIPWPLVFFARDYDLDNSSKSWK